MKIGERQQQGRGGAKPKTKCPKCGKEYLETAGGKKGKVWKRIGQYCPNPQCDYIIKDAVKLEEEERGHDSLQN
jgi:ssDNA-binding Zn-finger/Zn-ribbon topoisomerase 1